MKKRKILLILSMILFLGGILVFVILGILTQYYTKSKLMDVMLYSITCGAIGFILFLIYLLPTQEEQTKIPLDNNPFSI